MAVSRWRSIGVLNGPHRAAVADIDDLNEVFSAAFTDRYRRDGLSGVRVPFLNPIIWRYAIEDAAEGAMVWRDDRGHIAAFNMVHQSGAEGWMGPLAVRGDQQGHGVGKDIVGRGMSWLRDRKARVIGLETMPRTMDNIGFYSRLGFVPGQMTLTLSLEATRQDHRLQALGRLPSSMRDHAVAECAALVQKLHPAADYSREVQLTADLELGETLLWHERDQLVGFALAHTAPLVEGRTREELRVLKLALVDEARFGAFARAISGFARDNAVRRVSFRMQGEYSAAYRQAVTMGMQVRWSDLRMTLDGFRDAPPREGMILSNWEI